MLQDAVHTLAKFTRSPQSKHWTAIKCVFWYLKGTHDFTSHMADQIIQTIPRSQCIVMWTGHQAQTGNLLVDMFSYLQEAQFLGVQRNRQPLCYQLWKLSMLLLPMLLSKSCGTEHYLMNSKSHNLRHQFYSQTIRPQFLFYTILNFMCAQAH
jgi:hypothetical protein